MAPRPTAIDLFAGAGGLSLGFEQAGFEVVAAVEMDPVHAAVHAYNFPHTAVLPRSITQITGAQLRQQAQLISQDIDLVIGGPPCQGFSLMGQRHLEDPRNALGQEFLRLIQELSPRFFLFENVKGLTVGPHRQVLEELVVAFDHLGYRVRQPWQVLNAVHYGVPQNRERLFLLGARHGLPLPTYPVPQTRRPNPTSSFHTLPQAPTCADALGDLPEAELFPALQQDDAVYPDQWGIPSAYGAELRCLTPEAWHYGYRRRWQPGWLTSSLRTDHTDRLRQRFAATPPGQVEPISRFFKLAPNGVANTLRAGTDSARGSFTSPRPIHYAQNRCITVREMARLHGFPDWFRLHKTKWHGARQVGNAVPPPLARALAQAFLQAMDYIPSPPSDCLGLGDPHLLTMDMTQAARFWGVAVPIGQRDRRLS